MSITVYKKAFRLADVTDDDTVKLDIPAFAEFLTVAKQLGAEDELSVWFRCNPEAPLEPRYLYVVSTGMPAPVKHRAPYLSTVILHNGALVLHFFTDGRSA